MTVTTVPGLDVDTARLIELVASVAPDATVDASADRVRQGFGDMIALMRPRAAEPFDGEIEDVLLGGVPVRRYRPHVTNGTGDVVLWIHGGGWVAGELESADPHARAVATRMHCAVVSIDYRRAPEHPYPAALDDCVAVLQAVARDAEWVGVAGDSAGGNLAAAVALVAAKNGSKCDGQLLFFPALDVSMGSSSQRQCARGFLLEADTLRWYWNCYDPNLNHRDDPMLSPLVADTGLLSRVAPAVITTAGFDPLRDEGNIYARRLIAAGVSTAYCPEPSLVHGYLDHTQLVPAALRARNRALDAFDALRSHRRAT